MEISIPLLITIILGLIILVIAYIYSIYSKIMIRSIKSREQECEHDFSIDVTKETHLREGQGITDQILKQQFIEKWDGKTPLYGNMPVTLFKNN